jgi:argininosuccinate lyase
MSAPGGKLWGGRFERAPDDEFYEFERSFPFDRRLLPFELKVNRVWARALVDAGVLSAQEATQIEEALDRIESRAAAEPAWVRDSRAEDVHHFIETAVVELVGEAGWKLHTGRSRNDLVSTSFRLFVKDAAMATQRAAAALCSALLEQAERHLGLPMPGMTHLQHAQPILYSHFLLAHFEAFLRDLGRLDAARRSADLCPLGSAALAGTSLPVDRAALAHELGFAGATPNSLDAVSARDFALDYLYALSVLASHLSRLAEDMVLFASSEFGFITPGDEYSTGSSLMPQKKNPDAWELIRGKTGRVTAALFSLLATLKGLPTGYQRDLQEDKQAVFGAHDQMLGMLRVAAGAVSTLAVNAERMRRAASDPALVATETADFLVRRGVPFRLAHEVVGRVVREAERLGCQWTALPLEKLRSFSPLFDESLYRALTPESALAARAVVGGTAPETVREALRAARERLAAEEKQ